MSLSRPHALLSAIVLISINNNFFYNIHNYCFFSCGICAGCNQSDQVSPRGSQIIVETQFLPRMRTTPLLIVWELKTALKRPTLWTSLRIFTRSQMISIEFEFEENETETVKNSFYWRQVQVLTENTCLLIRRKWILARLALYRFLCGLYASLRFKKKQ